MTQAHPVPDMHASGCFAIQHLTRFSVALLGACEGDDQIQLRAGIDNPADAAKHSIHFPKCSESIDINRLQTGGLRQQFFVCHDDPPEWASFDHDRDVTQARQETDVQPLEFFVAPHGINPSVDPNQTTGVLT